MPDSFSDKFWQQFHDARQSEEAEERRQDQAYIGSLAVTVGLVYAHAKRHQLTEMIALIESRHPEMKREMLPHGK